MATDKCILMFLLLIVGGIVAIIVLKVAKVKLVKNIPISVPLPTSKSPPPPAPPSPPPAPTGRRMLSDRGLGGWGEAGWGGAEWAAHAGEDPAAAAARGRDPWAQAPR